MSSTPNTASSSTASNSDATSSSSPQPSPTVVSTSSKSTSIRPPRRGQKNAPPSSESGSSKSDAEQQERQNLISTLERMNRFRPGPQYVPPPNPQRKAAGYIMELALRNPYKPKMDGTLDFTPDPYRDALEENLFQLEVATGCHGVVREPQFEGGLGSLEDL